MDDLMEEKVQCTCLVCGDMYTDPKRLHCGHLFCQQCLVEKAGLETECPDPDCRKVILPDSKKKVVQLQTDTEMVQRVRQLLRQGVNPYGPETLSKMTSSICSVLCLGTTHFGSMCDHCNIKGIDGAEYKCGICPNYVLCEACVNLPRYIVHWAEHIFIKVKTARTAFDSGVSLNEGLAMGRSQDYGNSDHMTAKCDSCNVQPIRGTKFKCGMCADYKLCEKCEEKSLEIHDKFHVFLVLPHACTDPPPGRQIPYEFFDKEVTEDKLKIYKKLRLRKPRGQL